MDAVLPGSMAAAAGVEPEDELMALAQVPLCSRANLRAALRAAAQTAHATLEFRRRGLVQAREVVVQEQPPEQLNGVPTQLEQLVQHDGTRMRLLVNRPPSESKRGFVLLLQGLSAESAELPVADSTMRRTLQALLQAGFTLLRLERRGLGDSEGDIERTDLQTELEDYCALLRRIEQLSPTEPVHLWGHSLGGMLAPLLANERTGCLIVYGTSAIGWRESVREAGRLQHQLGGLQDAAAEALISANLARYTDSAVIDDRPKAYYEQLEASDLGAAWSRCRARVLAVTGEYDWVTPPARSRQIAELVSAGGGVGVARILPCLDHLGAYHGSLEESLARYGFGLPSSLPGQETLRFLG